MSKLKIGSIYQTKNCGSVIIVEQLSKRYYNVQFQNTGTIEKYREDAIAKGEIRDPYARLKCGVACTGKVKTKGSNNQIYNVWAKMINRCYNENDNRAKCNLNTIVCNRWLVFENFLNDYMLIDGYDEEKFRKGLIQLDKDLKQRHQKRKIYSLETCTWLSNEENAKMQDFQMKKFKAISPTGEIFYSDNITDFARQHEGLTRRHISGVLHGRAKSTAGWKFVYEEIV